MSAAIRTRGKSRTTIERLAAAIEILEEIQPASVRAVCYRLFVLKLIPDMSKASTNAVSRILTRAREEDEIDWDWIVDETREAETAARWTDPDEIIRATVRDYRRDYWQDQECRVEIWSEKGTVRGTLAPVLDEYGITLRVLHGYGSATAVHDPADESTADDRPLHVLYVGDWDPSGLHMSEIDLPARIERYGGEIDITRVAIVDFDLDDLPCFKPETKKNSPALRMVQAGDRHAVLRTRRTAAAGAAGARHRSRARSDRPRSVGSRDRDRGRRA